MVELLGKSPFLEKTIYEQPKSQGPGEFTKKVKYTVNCKYAISKFYKQIGQFYSCDG